MCIHKRTLPFPSTELWGEELRKIMSDLLLFSCSVLSSFLRPRGLQDARPPCPSPTPGACSNSCPVESVMPSNYLILYHPLLLLPSIFPSIRVFSNESALCIRWLKYDLSKLLWKKENLVSLSLTKSRNITAFEIFVLSQFSSVAQSWSDSLRPHGLQDARPPCPSPTPGV